MVAEWMMPQERGYETVYWILVIYEWLSSRLNHRAGGCMEGHRDAAKSALHKAGVSTWHRKETTAPVDRFPFTMSSSGVAQ